MQALLQNYLDLGAIVFVYMSLWFFVSLVKKRNDVADIAWGLGFVFISWFAFILGGFSTVSLTTNLLVTVWGFRLAYHIFMRNKGKPEDFRYFKWRKEWKNFAIRSFFQIFMLQGLLLYIIITPVVYINLNSPQVFNATGLAGIFIWIVGFCFEAVSDKQLAEFIKNPKNRSKIIQTGLWRFSRHPNYFGEVTMWWGIYLIALSSNGFWTIVGPLTITILILFVSGVPLLENKYSGRSDFEEYKRKTSIFFPLPPKP